MSAPTDAPAVLVADDSDQLRALVGEILRTNGYRVLEAASGDEALALAAERIVLVVADIVMPPEGGVALVDALRRRIAGLKVLFISGYGAIPAGSGNLDPVLAKPFTTRQLLSRIEALAPEARSA